MQAPRHCYRLLHTTAQRQLWIPKPQQRLQQGKGRGGAANRNAREEKKKSFRGALSANGMAEFGAVFISIKQLKIMT